MGLQSRDHSLRAWEIAGGGRCAQLVQVEDHVHERLQELAVLDVVVGHDLCAGQGFLGMVDAGMRLVEVAFVDGGYWHAQSGRSGPGRVRYRRGWRQRRLLRGWLRRDIGWVLDQGVPPKIRLST